jgi:glucose/arabinose dehydrogenase
VSGRLVPLGLFPPLNYDERGLLGFAMHPNFAANPKVYTYTAEPVAGPADFTTSQPVAGFDHQNVLAEWTVDSLNPDIVNPASRRELLRVDHPQFNHDGGTLRFGPDGKLCFSIGDGGGGDDQGEGHDPAGNSRNSGKIYGKVLRIDPDGSNSANGKYGIPADNPFASGGGLPEAWATGFRNPFSFHFDPATGLLYLGDAGQNRVEELDIVVRGGDYGWRAKEGGLFFDPAGPGGNDGAVVTIPVEPLPKGITDPFLHYDHSEGIVTIAGPVYHGSSLPALQNRLVLGDFSRGFVIPSGRLFYVDAANTIRELQIGAGNIPLGAYVKGFGQDAAGDVYVCVSRTLGPFGTTGQLLKLVPLSAAEDWQAYE